MKPINILKAVFTLTLAFVAVFLVQPEVSAFAANVLPESLHSILLDSTGAVYATIPLVTVFSREVEEKMSPDNTFYLHSVDESSMLDGKTVRRNVAGDDPEAVTDPTVFPLPVEETEEDSNDYDVALHATKPQRIADVDSYILNFSRREIITNAHARVLNNKVAQEFIYNWMPTASGLQIATTGSATTAVLASKGATGNRKAITKNDWIDAGTKLMAADCWDEGMMYALVHANHYGQLKKIEDFIDFQKTGRSDMLQKGVIGEINGIKIKVRSQGAIYTSGGVRKKISSATATTDNAAVLVWSAAKVYRALSSLTTYYNPDQGQYLGATINFSLRAGGNIRKDEAGVVSIVEASA